MIVVRLSGGLGNQMFQYAFGKHLSIKHRTSLKMDVSYFEEQKLRTYELNAFVLAQDFISKEEIKNSFFDPGSLLKKIKRKISGNKVITEKQFGFDPSAINESVANTYLSGYWQCERYFRESEQEIRRSFVLKNFPAGKNEELLSRIRQSNAISLHIRRGDYITDAKTNTVHGTCDLEYYKRAIALIEKEITSPMFYIFSDDIEWVKQNLTVPAECFFVDNNSENGSEDMRLMMNCKHNIIANSSFSWWAAWLNENKDKKVIAPTKWFNDVNINTNDLIPASWLKL